MPTILLVRHGENDYVKTGRLAGRLPGIHLNERGRAQAQAVADALSRIQAAQQEKFKQEPLKKEKTARKKDAQEDGKKQELPAEGFAIKAVYSSPMERTMETAEPVAKALGLEVIPRQGLIETHFGEWQDKKVKGLSRLKVWQIVQNTPSLFCFPGGESFAESQHRMVQELRTLSEQHQPEDVFVCVSHSDPIKLVVAYYLGLPLDLFQRLSVSPASITTLYLGPDASRLLNLNVDCSFIFPRP